MISTSRKIDAYKGRMIDIMPKITADGKRPLSIYDVMALRLNSVGTSIEDVMLYAEFDTSDAFAYHQNHRAKIILDAKPLREISPESGLSRGFIGMNETEYSALLGNEYHIRDLFLDGSSYNKSKILDSAVWRALSRDDDSILRDYVDLMRSLKNKMGFANVMGFEPASNINAPSLRSIRILRCDEFKMSGLESDIPLDYADGFAVGVLPNVSIRYNKKIPSAKNNFSGYKEFVMSDVLPYLNGSCYGGGMPAVPCSR